MNNKWAKPKHEPQCPPPSFNHTACDESLIPAVSEEFYNHRSKGWVTNQAVTTRGQWHLPCRTKLIHNDGRNFWSVVKTCEYKCNGKLVERHKSKYVARCRYGSKQSKKHHSWTVPRHKPGCRRRTRHERDMYQRYIRYHSYYY